MDKLQKYKYLTMPVIGITLFYVIGLDIVRIGINLTMLVNLIAESYDGIQTKNKFDTLIKLWIVFGLIFGIESLILMFTDKIPFPSISNALKISFLAWILYNPKNFDKSFEYIEPYLKLMIENYNKFNDLVSQFNLF